VHFRRVDAASQAFVVRSRSGDHGAVWIEHVRGRIAVVNLPLPAALDTPAISARCGNDQREFRGDEQAVNLEFGPRWANRRRIAFGKREALIELALPPAFESDLEQHALHPALMDWATGGAQKLIPGYDESQDFFVPASYGRVRMFAPLVPRLVAHVRLRDDDAAGDEIASFDITIADSQGRVLVDVSEFTMIRVRDKALLAAAASGGSESTAGPAPAGELHKPQATANPILTLGLRDGIRPEEGADALARILAAGAGPQVVVSPQDLAALVAHLRAPAERPASGSPASATGAAAAPARDVSALEAALASHQAVREAAAAAHGERVLAYVAYHPEHSITVSELRRHVRGLVSEDLVPQTVIELDALPRAADGEIDRAALPNPFAAEEAAPVGPRTQMEQTIAALWQDLLGVESVGVHDNFFDIGGHSLLSVRFIMRLDKKIGVRLLHEHVVVNTLEQIAAKCAQMGTQTRGDAAPVITPSAPAAAASAAPAAEPAAQAPAKPRGLLGAVKQAVLGR
jgi:hypothetical protein